MLPRVITAAFAVAMLAVSPMLMQPDSAYQQSGQPIMQASYSAALPQHVSYEPAAVAQVVSPLDRQPKADPSQARVYHDGVQVQDAAIAPPAQQPVRLPRPAFSAVQAPPQDHVQQASYRAEASQAAVCGPDGCQAPTAPVTYVYRQPAYASYSYSAYSACRPRLLPRLFSRCQ